MGYYTPPSSGGGGGFPSVVKSVNYTAQSGSLSFNLADNPATGGYTLNDYLTVTTADTSAKFNYEVDYADPAGAAAFGAGAITAAQTGPASIMGLNMFSNIPGASPGFYATPPAVLDVVNGTPLSVSIVITPSAIGTASPTSGNAGLLFAPGDTFTIDTGNGDANGHVLTVGAGGAVLTVAIDTPGSGYTVSNGNGCTATSGTGTGLQIDILTLSTTLQYSYHADLVRNS